MKTEKGTTRSIMQVVAWSPSSTRSEQMRDFVPLHPAPPCPWATANLPRVARVGLSAALLLFAGMFQSALGQAVESEIANTPYLASAPVTPQLLAVTGPHGRNPFSFVSLQTQPVAEVLIGETYSMLSSALDFAPNGNLYGLGLGLSEIDPDTGLSHLRLANFFGVPSSGTMLRYDIAFHPNGTLYLMILRQLGADYFQNEFYILDVMLGIARQVCSMPGVLLCIDFSPTGVLYGEGAGLCIVDLERKTLTPVGDTMHPTRAIIGMDWASDGYLYGVDMLNRFLCQIDPATGGIVHEYGPYASDLMDVVACPTSINAAGMAGSTGSEKFCQICVPVGRTKLEITTSGGTGDVDVYVKKGSDPTVTDYGWRSNQSGNNESVSLDNPQAGTYHIMLKGYANYSGVTLKVAYLP